MAVEGSPVDELPVTFHPALYLQRRGWVLDIMRREGITEVVDIGCGEGELLSCLCNPAPWLAPPPPDVPPPDRSATGAALDELHHGWLHPTRIAGLDICATDLECAARVTKPPAPEGADVVWHSTPVRWEPLEVKVWEGSLEHVNAEFVGVECVVATEVIEHLHERVLDRFVPVVFGAYHPRAVLITTPSFTFNARFTAPDAPLGARSGWRDPTGRTDRIFRHHDHKFEWTVEEFKEWCNAVAGEWGYAVEIGGVGKAQEVDEWGRDEALAWASQVAAFIRIEGEEWAKRRAGLWEASDGGQSTMDSPGTHSLLATHQHSAHQASCNPRPMDDIGELVTSKMLYYRETSIALTDIWHEREVQLACGGRVDWLVDAIQKHSDLGLRKGVLQSRIDREWIIDLDPALHHLIPPPVTQEEMWPSPPDTGELLDPGDPDDGSSWCENGSIAVRDATLDANQEGWGRWGEENGRTHWGEAPVDLGWGKDDGDCVGLEWGCPEDIAEGTWTWN